MVTFIWCPQLLVLIQSLLHRTMGLKFASAHLYWFVSVALHSTLWYDSWTNGKLPHWIRLWGLLLAFSQNVRPTLCGCFWKSHFEWSNSSAFSLSVYTVGHHHRNGPVGARAGGGGLVWPNVDIYIQPTRELFTEEDIYTAGSSRVLSGLLSSVGLIWFVYQFFPSI